MYPPKYDRLAVQKGCPQTNYFAAGETCFAVPNCCCVLRKASYIKLHATRLRRARYRMLLQFCAAKICCSVSQQRDTDWTPERSERPGICRHLWTALWRWVDLRPSTTSLHAWLLTTYPTLVYITYLYIYIPYIRARICIYICSNAARAAPCGWCLQSSSLFRTLKASKGQKGLGVQTAMIAGTHSSAACGTRFQVPGTGTTLAENIVTVWYSHQSQNGHYNSVQSDVFLCVFRGFI